MISLKKYIYLLRYPGSPGLFGHSEGPNRAVNRKSGADRL